MNSPNLINRNNNFDFLRLLFASLVIVSHSFPLTGQKEIFGVLTNEQISFGELSVNCFFIMSGYLIFQSLERSKTWTSYLWKRVLRLFPALFVLLLFTGMILPIFYQGNDILDETSYWTYFPNGMSLYRIQYDVAGIFETNPYPKAINGSLWSLSYEFTLYLFLLILFPIRRKKNSIKIILTASFLISFLLLHLRPMFLSHFFQHIFLGTELLYKLATFFLAGSLLSFFDLKKYNTLYVRIGLATGIILSVFFGCYQLTSPFLLPILVLMLATLDTSPINTVGKRFGDISYGVYIYGFLVQQILMNYLDLNPVQLMAISLPITFVLAYFSWHLVEERMLKYKNVI